MRIATSLAIRKGEAHVDVLFMGNPSWPLRCSPRLGP